MARKKTTFTNGAVQYVTHVKSRSYGDHTRSKRGTFKPATINEAMQDEGKKLVAANIPAKLIKDALDPFRGDFPGGMMWQRLVSVFKRQYKDAGTYDFHELKGFEISTVYPLSRLMHIAATSTEGSLRNQATLGLTYYAPQFSKNKSITHYRLQAIALFLTGQKVIAKNEYSEVLKIGPASKRADIGFTISRPAKASLVIWCVKVEGYADEVPWSTAASKGMRIVEVCSLK